MSFSSVYMEPNESFIEHITARSQQYQEDFLQDNSRIGGPDTVTISPEARVRYAAMAAEKDSQFATVHPEEQAKYSTSYTSSTVPVSTDFMGIPDEIRPVHTEQQLEVLASPQNTRENIDSLLTENKDYYDELIKKMQQIDEQHRKDPRTLISVEEIAVREQILAIDTYGDEGKVLTQQHMKQLISKMPLRHVAFSVLSEEEQELLLQEVSKIQSKGSAPSKQVDEILDRINKVFKPKESTEEEDEVEKLEEKLKEVREEISVVKSELIQVQQDQTMPVTEKRNESASLQKELGVLEMKAEEVEAQLAAAKAAKSPSKASAGTTIAGR